VKATKWNFMKSDDWPIQSFEAANSVSGPSYFSPVTKKINPILSSVLSQVGGEIKEYTRH